MNYRKLWLWVLITFLSSQLGAQESYAISWTQIDSTKFQEDWTTVIPISIDSAQAQFYADSLTRHYRSLGYLIFNVDSIERKDSTFLFHVYAGDLYSLDRLHIDAEDRPILEGSGILNSQWSTKVLNAPAIAAIKEKVSSHLAERGYPFAQVGIDSLRVDKNRLESRLVVDKKALITYDSITILGSAQISKNFLHRYLQVEQGQAYNHRQILTMKNKIRDLSFVKFREDPRITFVNDKAFFQLPLDSENASRFDFIIGVLPQTVDGNQTFTVTGDFTGEFVNKLGNGESFFVQYKRLRPETQDLNLSFNYPFILGQAFGLDGSFQLFRNTNNFLELNATAGIQYFISGNSYLKASWEFHSSTLVEIDTTSLLSTRRLPAQLDVSTVGGGITYGWDRLDYKFNPRKGLSIWTRITAGQKRIRPNLSIVSLSSDEVDFSMAYDSLQLRSFQAEISMQLDYYIPFQNWATFHLANRSAYKYNEVAVFDNEFYRLGGNRLLRGFNEETVFSPAYSIFTAEFRIILDRLSYITLPFIDYGLTQVRDDGGELIWDRAMGVGIGLNFGTPAGIFNISFAAGRRLGAPLAFDDTKIHFGYVNLF